MRQLRNVPTFLAAGVVMIGGAAAHAQSPGYYVAVPATQQTRATLVVRETPWVLRGNAYVAARAPERDAVLCEAVARNVGALSSFTVAGQPYDTDQLAKCNAHAKGAGGVAMAQAR